MQKSLTGITGILLAGGKSRRMGREKGEIQIGTRHLYQYPLDILQNFCNEILISSCREASFPSRYPTVCDEIEGLGPMGGIYTCLKHSSNELNLILSYDMPLVSKELVSYLLEKIPGHDIALPALSCEKPEPLSGIYRKHTSSAFKTLIDQKDLAVHHVLPLVKSNIVLIHPGLSFWNPRLFLNINREEDLNRLPPEYGKHLDEH